MNTDMLRNSIQNAQLVLGYNRLKFWWSCCISLCLQIFPSFQPQCFGAGGVWNVVTNFRESVYWFILFLYFEFSSFLFSVFKHKLLEKWLGTSNCKCTKFWICGESAMFGRKKMPLTMLIVSKQKYNSLISLKLWMRELPRSF